MSALEIIAKQVLATKGTEHMHALQTLRQYMTLTPEQDIITYINMLTDLDILRTLVEAGLRGDTWKAAVKRTAILAAEKRGGA